MPNLEKFGIAIKASGMTQQQACDLAGFSKPTLNDRINDPLQFRLGELKLIYDGMNSVGKQLVRETMADIFLP